MGEAKGSCPIQAIPSKKADIDGNQVFDKACMASTSPGWKLTKLSWPSKCNQHIDGNDVLAYTITQYVSDYRCTDRFKTFFAGLIDFQLMLSKSFDFNIKMTEQQP